jgi:HEAT repeat protein
MDAAEGDVKPATEEIQRLQKLALKDSGGAPGSQVAPRKRRREAVDSTCRALLDPQGPPLTEALRLARQMRQETTDLSLRLLRCAAEMRESGTDPDPRRLLALLSDAPGGARLAYALIPYMRSADPQIRSKAALLIARTGFSLQWALRQLEDPDPRVRANVVEGIGASPEPRRFLGALRRAARDPHHRVATTALIVLVRLGAQTAAEDLREMASHPDPRFRAAAAWAMGQVGAAQFEPVLQTLRRDPHHAVRFCALRALVRRNGRRSS